MLNVIMLNAIIKSVVVPSVVNLNVVMTNVVAPNRVSFGFPSHSLMETNEEWKWNGKDLSWKDFHKSFWCYAILSTVHLINTPFCQLTIILICILSTDYFVNLPICQAVIFLSCILLNLPFRQLTNWSTRHFANQLYQLAILSICHCVLFNLSQLWSNFGYFHTGKWQLPLKELITYYKLPTPISIRLAL